MLKATILACAALFLGACAGAGTAPAADSGRRPSASSQSGQAQTSQRLPGKARRVDPRRGGLEIGLGEWALAPEASAIRPGRVTFVIHNRGTMGHGFEVEIEGESSGHGSGDLFKAESELLMPGESTRMSLRLGPGLYKIECLVDGHDDMGMEGFLEVRADAPRIRVNPPPPPGRITIDDFAFAPAVAAVEAGTEVSWRNHDSTEHTVTAVEGAFGSDTLGPRESFSYRFDRRGTFEYRCAIHPDMTGTVKVE